MAAPGSSAGQKRKAQHMPQGTSSNVRKRQKFQEARAIPTQTADAALSKTGELNIASFVKSREYEINALDKSIKRARQSLSTRAFQQVPRHMRRRTASHNAKKVPRHLRGRAKQEMIEDNTPTVNSKTRIPASRLRLRLETAKALKKLTQKRKTVRQKKREAKANAAETDPSKHLNVVRIPRIKKNKLADPPLATSKFKKRQVRKTWLPTHLWHTKRAHMTRPTEPLWRLAIPLRPTEKSYRSTHRSSGSRGCVAWDMSYISTVCCRGRETTLEGLLKALNFHGNGWSGQRYEKWKAGSRFASGWINRMEGVEALAIVDVLWCAPAVQKQDDIEKPVQVNEDVEMTGTTVKPKRQRVKLDRKIMVRIHPSAFQQFWIELLRAAKTQKPQVLVEDLRFEIGSIEIKGPGSTEALAGALRLSDADGSVVELWNHLLPLSNPALLPLNAILSFGTRDPRLLPPSSRLAVSRSETSEATLHELIIDWPFDSDIRPSRLFSYKARYHASKLPSQWTLNRRRQAVLPGQLLQVCPKDPSIPLMLLAHRPVGSTTTQQGTWTLLAPWKCIDVIWRKLLFCPLSSGSRPRFGGLREKQQMAFEQCAPWYPADYPGTEAGKAWERTQAERRFDEWVRRPPSRRIVWERLDLGLDRRGELGRGWTCDWEYLLQDPELRATCTRVASQPVTDKATSTTLPSQPLLTQRQRRLAKAKVEANEKIETRRRNTSSPDSDGAVDKAQSEAEQFMHLAPLAAKSLLQSRSVAILPTRPALATIRISYLTRGTPSSAARIYRLPLITSTSLPQILGTSTTRTNTARPKPSETTPPAIQPSPPLIAIGISAHTAQNTDLRSRWLSLDPQQTPRVLPCKLKKDKLNRRGLPCKAQHHSAESLSHINVLPKNAPPAIREQYGSKPVSEEERKLNMEKELVVCVEERKVWDTHVPCPDTADLIGFVTSGSYNLAEGKGTAIGAIWLQRVLQGWIAEADDAHHTSPGPNSGAAAHQAVREQKQRQPQKANRCNNRERQLCIVRNAGESIGRLATWELCE